ncbi:hypothetical protein R69888_02596 [Paraburkholderia haematera]|uniref:Uncharacterized protein n=1 Tax=Paraburkholderia haematera TaxID=2793077 RepID=A0ABM8RAR6_9BURK|nr:hypothetical protein R69888_02596 [Paraburkholderia haematera]
MHMSCQLARSLCDQTATMTDKPYVATVYGDTIKPAVTQFSSPNVWMNANVTSRFASTLRYVAQETGRGDYHRSGSSQRETVSCITNKIAIQREVN